MQPHPQVSWKMKLILCICLSISLVLVPTISGQMWAMEYRGPPIAGMRNLRSLTVELGPSPYKERGDCDLSNII